MAKSVKQPLLLAWRHSRYSLRTLFFVSIAIAVPFLLLANLRHNLRPEESVASPLYLLLGIAGVVLAAAIGSALGDRTGTLVAASLAAFSWIGAVVLCGLFSKELNDVLPVHVLFAVATVGVLGAIVRLAARRPEEEGPHENLLKLLKVKHDVQESQHARHQDSLPDGPSIQNPDPKTQN